MFLKIDILKNFAKFHRKTSVPESLFNKLKDGRPAILLKRDSSTGVFLWNDRLRVSKVFWNFCMPTIYNFAVTREIYVEAIKYLLLYKYCYYLLRTPFYRTPPGDCFCIKDTKLLRNSKNRLIETSKRLSQHEIFPQIKCKKSGTVA